MWKNVVICRPCWDDLEPTRVPHYVIVEPDDVRDCYYCGRWMQGKFIFIRREV